MGIFDLLIYSKQKRKETDVKNNLELGVTEIETKPIQRLSLSQDEVDKLIQQIAKDKSTNRFNSSERDPLFEDAAKLIVSTQMGSTSLIQRRMKLGYNRAELLIDQLETAGIIGSNQGSKSREVNIKTKSDLEIFLNNSIPSVNLLEFYDQHKEEIEKAIAEYKKKLELDQLQQEKERMRLLLLEKDRKKQLSRTILKELIEEGAI